MFLILINLLILIVLVIFYYVFLVPTKFINFELKDRRSVVNARRKSRKFGVNVLPPYPNGWFALEQSINLKPGEAKSIDCLGENFVVFRSKSKEVFVLDAYCPHMGANLGVGGNVSGDCIECPFHAWKFSGETGECVDIPYSENFDDVKKQAKVKKWISREVNGFIYVWYHAENEEPWELPILNLENLRLQYSYELIVYAHIQDFYDNLNDQAHLATVHDASAFSGKYPNQSRLPTIINQIFKVKWWSDPKHSFKSYAESQCYFKLFNKYDVYRAQVDFTILGPGIIPFVVKTSMGDVTFILNYTPIDAHSLKVIIHTLSPFWLAWFAKFSSYSHLVNVARDQVIFRAKQFKANPLLVKEEKVLKESRNWYSRFYSPNSKTFEEARNSLDW